MPSRQKRRCGFAMPTTCSRALLGCWSTTLRAGNSSRTRSRSSLRTAAQPSGWRNGLRRGSRSAAKPSIDVGKVLLVERADGGLEPKDAKQVVEIRLREIAPRLEHI